MALASGENLPLFSEGTASTLRLIAYLGLAVLTMIFDHRNGYLDTLRQLAGGMIEPLYRVAALPSDIARTVGTSISSQQQLIDENRELRKSLTMAEARLHRLDTLSAQNARLQGLLEAQKSLGISVHLARLINVDLDPSRRRIVLDAGRDQGATVGQPVIDAHGVMGQIVEVLANTSVAMLVTDPSHAIPVMIERTGMRTIAVGNKQSGDLLELANIPTSADVQVGDKLVTSGLGGRFPAGFPVGTIRDISNDRSGMFASAMATPAAALNTSSDVLLLQNLPEPMGPPVESAGSGPPSELATPPGDSSTNPPAKAADTAVPPETSSQNPTSDPPAHDTTDQGQQR